MNFPKWECSELSRNVHRIIFDFEGTKDCAYILLRSDAHHDNPDADNEMEKRHLTLAKRRNAPIVDNGDAFCAMQGRWDKRSDKSALKPEHQVDDYLDALVSTYTDFLEPYAKQLAVIGTGNHETSILKHHETNLTERLVERLRDRTKETIYTNSYTGWIFVGIRRRKTNKGKIDSSLKIWRTHGEGGGAPVTRGVIQTARRAVYVPDANIVLSGHIHNEWTVPIQRIRVSPRGRVYQDEQLHIQIPSYKDSYKDGYSYGEWAIERGMPPKPTGAIWLKLTVDQEKIHYEVERAK